MTLRETIINKTQEEFKSQQAKNISEVIAFAEKFDMQILRDYLLFYTDRSEWKKTAFTLLENMLKVFHTLETSNQKLLIIQLTYLAVDLKSYLPHWYVLEAVSEDDVHEVFQFTLSIIRKLESTNPELFVQIYNYLFDRTVKRLSSEDVEKDRLAIEASSLCGNSVYDYIFNTIKTIENSNLLSVVLQQKKTEFSTIIGNDFGEFLEETLWLGASYVTTNPPLINLAWNIYPDDWKKTFADYVHSSQLTNASNQKLCQVATMLVVEHNCRKLRPLFLLSGGNTGYCCYQVNPHNHDSSENMVKEVEEVYLELSQRLEGIPNVSFKLPGTPASVEAAKILSKKGISLTITLNFSVFQAIEFAKIFQIGEAVTNNVVIMNGRLAFPVRDELIEKHIPNGAIASRYTGVEVTRHLADYLYTDIQHKGLGINREKVRIMNASLRIYGTEIPDLEELFGAPLITIFPNVRRIFDSIPRNVNSTSFFLQTPKNIIETLQKSTIFRQAWYKDGDDVQTIPSEMLTLDPKEHNSLLEWVPIKETLTQFLGSYAQLEQIITSIVSSMNFHNE